MLYADDNLNLTLDEMEKALRDAGISRPPSQWTLADTSCAQFVLAKAQDEKISRVLKEQA